MRFWERWRDDRPGRIRSTIENLRKKLVLIRSRHEYVSTDLRSQPADQRLEDKLDEHGRDLGRLEKQLQDIETLLEKNRWQLARGYHVGAEIFLEKASALVSDISRDVDILETKVDDVMRHKRLQPDRSPNIDNIEPQGLSMAREGGKPEIEIQYSSRNDKHHEDSVRIIANSHQNLKGIVICDGITNANGEVAARIVAETVDAEFRGMQKTSDVEKIRSQLDSIVNKAVDNIRERAGSGQRETATTLLLAFTDGSGFFIYYIGDGTIRQFTDDFYSVADYLLTYERGGALQGYIGSAGVISMPTLVYVDNKPSRGTVLLLASDGAELSDMENHLSLANKLRDALAPGEGSLRTILDEYLEHLTHRTDDATIGAIWIRNVTRRTE